jgi:hypothetical protein
MNILKEMIEVKNDRELCVLFKDIEIAKENGLVSQSVRDICNEYRSKLNIDASVSEFIVTVTNAIFEEMARRYVLCLSKKERID